MGKTKVTLGGVELAANAPITWRFQTGVRPFTTTMQVHKSLWPRLKDKVGKPLELKIKDSRDVETKIKDLYILFLTPKESKHRVTFVVADRRWRWSYQLVVRDYNVPKKSGDRTAFETVPAANAITVDEYDFKPYSLKGGTEKWQPRTAIEDLLEAIEPDDEPASGGGGGGSGGGPGAGGAGAGSAGGGSSGGGGGGGGEPGGSNTEPKKNYKIDSLPVDPDGGEDGEFTIQNLTIRDSGDVALARMLSYMPGAEVWVSPDGVVRVFDGTDLDAAKKLLKDLGPLTKAGQVVEEIDRTKIRPKNINIYYTRELEVAFDFEDNYVGTFSRPARDAPFLVNVLPTVDLETEISQYDPEADTMVTSKVPPGTWVDVATWLEAMDKKKPQGLKVPWNFDTLKRFWVVGDLERVLGGQLLEDSASNAEVNLRIQALKRHFRQTFQMSRRYRERVRDIRAVRVALLHPVTATRAPAGVWGQACIIPSIKGQIERKGDKFAGLYRNVDYYPRAGTKTVENPVAPASIQVIDKDQGVFRIDWNTSPYGTETAIIPCQLANRQGQTRVPQGDLGEMQNEATGPGYQIESAAGGLYLAPRLRARFILTVVPAAPNNKLQFQRVQLESEKVAEEFEKQLGKGKGEGPDLDIFVPPTEVTARFGWTDDNEAAGTIGAILGLNNEDPTKAGVPVETEELFGYTWVNKEREIEGYSKAMAAQALAVYADAVQGVAVTPMQENIKLAGNVSQIAVQIAGAPSGLTMQSTEFPGFQKPLDRYALLPEGARKSILGIVTFAQ